MEVQKASRSGQQQPVGGKDTVEEVVQHFLDLSLDNQRALLLTACPEIVPRLDDQTREQFIGELREVPRNVGKLSEPEAHERAESPNEVLEDLLEQSIGAQEHILKLVAPRVISSMDPKYREDYLRELDAAIAAADRGDVTPTIH